MTWRSRLLTLRAYTNRTTVYYCLHKELPTETSFIFPLNIDHFGYLIIIARGWTNTGSSDGLLLRVARPAVKCVELIVYVNTAFCWVYSATIEIKQLFYNFTLLSFCVVSCVL